MAEQRLTIRDVARRAGVSKGTVSNVINGGVAVRADRREQVLRAIEELGYLPNSFAQGLRRKRSSLIGIAVPHAKSSYLSALVEGLEDIAFDNGCEVMHVFTRQDPEREYRQIQSLLANRVAGLVLIPSEDPRRSFDLIARSKVPAVVVDRLWADARFDFVTIDNRRAMAELTEQLVALGHCRLLYVVSFPQLVTTRHRIEALEAAARTHAGVEAEVLQYAEDQAIFAAKLAATLTGPRPPTVIIASNSRVTMFTLRALQAAGVKIPDDVSLVSFEEPEWGDLVAPPLTVVRHPTREIAIKAWEILSARIDKRPDPPRHVELSAEILLGPSVARVDGPPSRRRKAAPQPRK